MMCIRAATVAGFEGRGQGHKPRNVGRLQKLGKDKEMNSPLEPRERNTALCSETLVRLLTHRNVQ